MATNDFVMPKLAMAMNEGTINEWLIKDGQHVVEGDPIMTVETEKVSYDLEAPQSGFFRIVVPAGETLPVQTVIGVFADSEEELLALAAGSTSDASTAATAPAPAAKIDVATPPAPAVSSPANLPSKKEGRIIASPLAKKMAKDRDLDLHYVEGTGPNGRIVKRDILRAETSGEGRPAAQIVENFQGRAEKARIPVVGMRAAISRNMMSQMQNTATLAQQAEADITELLALRKKFAAREEQFGTKVSVNAFFIKAIACAAKQYPILNASMIGDEIVVWDNVNVAFALALPSGNGFTENLVVPVVRNADQLSVVEIDKEMKRLIAKGLDGKLTPDDMSDSTITFSTTAGIGPPGTGGTAILNGENVCLVGIGGAKQKPAEHNGEIKLRQLAPMVLMFDHRVVDGAPASRFLNHLWQCIQEPALMLA
ncbi:MAG: dihydrolipoamide acetyltransferase family protein [Pseudomonadales bacterium]